MPVCGCMSHVQSGLTLWPLVPMLAVSPESFSCSPGPLGALVLVGGTQFLLVPSAGLKVHLWGPPS